MKWEMNVMDSSLKDEIDEGGSLVNHVAPLLRSDQIGGSEPNPGCSDID